MIRGWLINDLLMIFIKVFGGTTWITVPILGDQSQRVRWDSHDFFQNDDLLFFFFLVLPASSRLWDGIVDLSRSPISLKMTVFTNPVTDRCCVFVEVYTFEKVLK